MGNSKRSSESDDDDEQLNENVEFLKIIKNKKIKSVDEKKSKIDDALANGANVNFQDLNAKKRTALYYAVKNGEKEIVFHLLDQGANVITKDKDANPLECAEQLKQTFQAGSAEEQKYIEIIGALKSKISFNNPQPSTSHSQTSLSTLADKGNKENKQKLAVSQRDVVNTKSETYEAGGLKDKLHGTVYQLKLLMLFAKRCHDQGYKFRLATEMVDADKFDDIILELFNPDDNTSLYIFLQAKHSQEDGSKKIKSNDLLTKSKGDFSLLKYFKSYKNIKNNKKFQLQSKKYFIINTNNDFGFNDKSEPFELNDELKFELHNGKIENFNMKIQDGDKKSEFYKLIGSDHAAKRTKMVNELTEEFKKISLAEEKTDIENLAKELAEHLIYGKTISLSTLLFKEYQVTLVKAVIDIHYNKLRKEFINLDSEISGEAKAFREVLLKHLKTTLKQIDTQSELDKKLLSLLENEENQNLQSFWDEIGQITLKINNEYKKLLILESNPILKDPENFADEFARLFNKTTENKKICITISNPKAKKVTELKPEQKRKSFVKPILIPEIYKLSGHVLVKDEKNKNNKTKFSERFLNTEIEFEGDLEVFRKEFLIELKKEKNINIDELKNYTFQIESFVTCEETEVDELLAIRDFPSLEVTEEEIEGFINDLIFAMNQPNEVKLCEIIDKELGKEFNLIDSEFVTHDFLKRMLDWIKKKEGTYITEKCVDGFFEDFREKISQFVLIGPTSVHINKLKKTGIVFKFDAPKESNNKVGYKKEIKNVTMTLLLEFLNVKSSIQFCHLDTGKTSPLLGSVKAIQALKENKVDYICDGSVISIDLNTLLLIPERVLEACKKKTTRLLIVECYSKENIDNLKINLNSFNQKQLLLVGPTDNVLIDKLYKYYSESCLKIDDESVFNDLTEHSQEHLLKRTCKFQDYDVVLNQIFEKTVTNITNAIILAKLVDSENKFEIGKPIQSFNGYDKNYFIERTFWQESEKGHDLHQSDKINIDETYLQPPEKRTLDDLLAQSKQNTQKNFMIISDLAGMGKSAILNHLSYAIKKQTPHHWIVKIELSRHTDALKNCPSFTTESDAIDFISNKILKIQEPFEKELFEYLFKKKKVVLMLDAYDEISPIYENKVLDLLEILKNTENQLWITTRPHLKESLGKNQKDRVVFYNLEPFSQDDQLIFLMKFWSKKLELADEKNKLILNEKKIIKYAEELLKNLTRSIRDDKFTGIPLQTRMLAETFVDEISEYHNDSTKNEPVFEDQFDILDLYAKFYQIKYDLVSEKGTVVKDATFKIINNFTPKSVYINLALLMLFPDQERFLNIDKQKLLSLQIDRFGIAEIIDFKEIKFIHQTFAEYSVAEFFFEALTKNKPKAACSYFFTDVLLNGNCQMIRYFVDCFLKKNLISNENLKDYGEQIDKLWKDKTQKEKNNETILHVAAKEGNLHIVEFLSNCLKDQYKEIFKSLLEKRFENQLAWHDAVSEGHVEILKVLWDWAKHFKLDLKTMLLGPGKLNNNTWIQASLNNNFGFLKRLWQWAQLKINLLLLNFVIHNNSVFNSAVESRNIEDVQTLKDWAAEIECGFTNDSLFTNNNYGITTFHLAAWNGHVEVLKLLRNWAIETECDFKNDLLLSQNKNGNTTFHLAALNGHVEVIKILRNWATETECDFKNDLSLTKNNNGDTIFHLAAWNGHVEVLKTLQDWATETECDFKNDLLITKNNYKNTIFHLAALNGHVEVLIMLRDFAAETDYDFKNDLLITKNKNGNTAFHQAAIEGHGEVIKILRDWAAETKCDFKNDLLITKNKNGDTIFHLAAWNGHVEVLKMLRDFAAETECDFKNDLLITKNKNGNTAFHLAAIEGHVEILKMLRDWATKTKCDFKNDLLLFKNKTGNTAFQLATWNGHDEVLKMLRDWATDTECDFKNDLLLSKNNDGDTTFHLAAWQGHVEVLKTLRDWAIETECDIKNDLLITKSIYENTTFHLAALNGHVEVLKILRDWATETESDFKNDLLLSKNIGGNTAFHLAAWYGHVEVLKILRDWAKETNCDFKNDLLLFKNNNGNTSFHLAKWKDHIEVLNTLRIWTNETQSVWGKIGSYLMD